MQVLFESSAPDGARVHQVATRRARFVMRRLSWLIPGVRIVLSDVNGKRGGIDKRCHVEVRTLTGARVMGHALATDWNVAVDLALRRAARAVSKAWRRLHERQRPVLRALHGH